MPEIPRGTVGYIFVVHGRAVGAEMFGREDLARELLPKLLDSRSATPFTKVPATSASASGRLVRNSRQCLHHSPSGPNPPGPAGNRGGGMSVSTLSNGARRIFILPDGARGGAGPGGRRVIHSDG